MHEKYGPVVRLAPDELSFASADAWKDIYGHRAGLQHHGQDEFDKYATFYRSKGVARSIINEDREQHALLRRQLSHGFSQRCMREQEPIIGGYVNLLVRRLREQCVDLGTRSENAETGAQSVTKKNPMNMTTWYNWTTFDIIGDLAFGEPFGCLDRAQYDPWVATITSMVRVTSIIVSLKYLGLEALIRLVFMISNTRKEYIKNTREKLLRRMAVKIERPDLIEGLLKNKGDWVNDC
jgi:Cytochrome P450